MNWIRNWEHGDGDYAESLDGIEWHACDLPPWDHQCWAQTRGWLRLNFIRRCPCGATWFNESGWMERNQTRLGRGEKPPVVSFRAPRRLARLLWAAGARR